MKKNLKFETGDIVRIWKYKKKKKNGKGYTPNWLEENFKIKKVKKMCRGLILLVVLMERKLNVQQS